MRALLATGSFVYAEIALYAVYHDQSSSLIVGPRDSITSPLLVKHLPTVAGGRWTGGLSHQPPGPILVTGRDIKALATHAHKDKVAVILGITVTAAQLLVEKPQDIVQKLC